MANRKRSRQKGTLDYAMTFAQCREAGHWWEYDKWDGDAHGIHYVCTRGCKTVRVQQYNPVTMRKIKSRYQYPSGYLMADTTKVDAAIACRRLLERLVKSRGVNFLRRERALRQNVKPDVVAAKAE